MADIFISYSSEDRDRIIPVVRALEAHGWSVWWDRVIPPGKTFTRVIEEALGAARCLIVLWTEISVKSDWVNNEAAEGARKKILIPALLDEVEIPFEFRRIQAANLIGWSGRSDHAGFQQLTKALTDLLGPPAAKVPVPEPPEKTPAQPIPPHMRADQDRSPHPGPSERRIEIGAPRTKGSAARIGGSIALAVVILAGAMAIFRTELFQSRRMPSDDSAPRPGVEIPSPSAKPEPLDTTRITSMEPSPEAPASETVASTPPVKPEPEMPTKPVVEEPKPEAREDTGSSTGTSTSPSVKPEPQRTAQPFAKESQREVPAPYSKAPILPAKPEAPKSTPSTVKAAKPEAPSPGSKTAAPPVKPEEAPPAAARVASPRKTLTNSIGMEFVLIPAAAGPVIMGSRLGADELIQRFGGTEVIYKGEKPFRPVKIERPFYVMRTPVTQGQWRSVMGDNPSSFKECGEDCPVEMVSWEDAQRFIAMLNQLEGTASYRLPSEAEWEYACRAGNDSEYFFGNDPGKLGEFAWYSANSSNQTHPVGRKKSNAWGLFDMSGNVWEWVEDDWHSTYEGAPSDATAWVEKKRGSSRVVRGGGWSVIARYCRSAARYYGNVSARTSHVGLRLVRSVGSGS